MALTNYERVKRWREKNRVIYNLRRRNARKNLGAATGGIAGVVERGGRLLSQEARAGMSASENIRSDVATQTSKDETLAKLREMVKVEQEKPRGEAPVTPVKPLIYRNDHGGVISEFEWEKLQKLKQKAKNGGYEIDEYSQ
jgi:hypothetical protein